MAKNKNLSILLRWVCKINYKDKNNFIIVYDNEPRSPETIKKIDKAITLGYKVCIWPDDILVKDVNDRSEEHTSELQSH